jgi:Outer membrane protein beta-barrel domain
MKKSFVLIFLVGLMSLASTAQDKLEVFGGYQYLHTGNISVDGQSDPSSSQGFNGWDGSATGYFNRFLGVTGDFGGAYATVDGVSGHIYTYTGGPVVAFRVGKINPFVHALFGGVHLTGSESGVSVSRTGFTTMFGGGVDYKVIKPISIRVIDVDWLYYHFGSTTIAATPVPSFSQNNNVRITAGVVLGF